MFKLIITLMFQALEDYIHTYICMFYYLLCEDRKQRLRENKGYVEESGFTFISNTKVCVKCSQMIKPYRKIKP